MPAAYPKVLFLPRWYPGRNDPQIGVFIQKHAAAVGRYCDVKVLFAEPVSDLPARYEVERKADPVDQLWVYYRRGKGLAGAWRYWRAMRKGWAILAKEGWQADLVHVHVMLRNAVFAWLKGWPMAKPFLISEHASGYLNGKMAARGGFYKALMMKCFWQAKKITAVSAHLAAGIKAYGAPGKVLVIPNVVDPLSGPSLDIDRPRKHPLRVLTIADMVDDIKNVSGAIAVIGELVRSGLDITYHLVGGGPDEVKLKEQASSTLPEDRIIFHGMLDHKATMGELAQADVLLSNSRSETFGLVIAEAIAMGKPVVATRSGGAEQFVNEDTGILVDVDATEQLKQAVAEVVNELDRFDPKRIQASLGGRFTAEVVGGQFHELYKQILRS